MSCKGVPMHRIQEILRLSRTMKRSLREIVTDRPNGATHDRVNGASGRCVFSS